MTESSKKEPVMDRDAEKLVSLGLGLPICAGIFSGPAIWVYQIYFWLRYGYWKSIPTTDLWIWMNWGYPQFKWAGLQKLLEWLPLSLSMPVATILFLLILIFLVRNN